MKKFLLVLTVFSLIAACSQNTNKKEFEAQPAAQMPAQPTFNHEQSSSNMKVTKPVELLPEISQIYSGIKVAAVNKNDNSTIEVIVPFSTKTPIGNTGLSILVNSYFTNFTISSGGVTNVSMEEKNPGAKVVLFDNDTQVFDSWLFQNHPDMHSFEHPVWRILMISGVKK